MKTAKRITAILLCFVMLLGVCITSASALEIGEEFDWIYEDEVGEAHSFALYGGTVNEGLNEVTQVNMDVNTGFEFKVAKDGFYKLTYRESDFDEVCFAESFSDGKAKNISENVTTVYADEFGTLFHSDFYYLKKGVTVLIAYILGGNDATAKINIDYFADSITDVSFENEGEATNLFVDYDCYISEDGKSILDIKEPCSITFSNQEVVKTDPFYDTLTYTSESKIVPGENTVKIILPNFEKEIKVNVLRTSDYIESVVPENVDKHLDAKEYYDGSFEHLNWYDGENITFNFKDGTSKTVKYQSEGETYVTLPCGREFFVNAGYSDTGWCVSYGEDEAVFYVQIGDTLYYSKECNVEKASFKENSDLLKSRINNYYNWIPFEWYISRFLSTGNVYYLKNLIGSISNSTYFILKDISKFIRFYI